MDLASFTDFEQLKGLRFAGTANGDRVLLEWPLGRFAEHRGSGHLVVTPPAGVQPMTASLAAASRSQSRADRGLHEWGPFAPVPLPRHLPIAGELTYRFDPEQVYFEPSRFATEHTDVTFQGSTAWGDRARMAFHVTSSDWQESDQVLAGIMTDFGAPTGPVTFGGRGEFDGMMTGPFRRPRVEGEFSGEDLRGFDTLWGAGDAHIVVENGYVRVSDGIVTLNDSEMRFDGLFSLGFPRDDGGEEINARIRVVRRDVDSLRHAFGIDEYPVSGLLSGEFQLTGEYLRPVGFGGMTLDNLVAYGEPLQTATASLRFDGLGVRLDGVTVEKGGGTITGAAFVGWDSTYSFNLDGRRIPVEKISKLAYARAPLSGIAEFSASGSATFDQPRNDYKFRVNDLFVGEEGVGQVTGSLALRGTELSGEIDAASPRLAITATGHIAVTPQADSEIIVRFHDMSLDPVRPAVRAPAVAVHDRGGERIGPHRRPSDRRRSPARRRDDRHRRPAPVRLRVEERGADPDLARQSRGQDRRSPTGGRRHEAPRLGHDRLARRADWPAGGRRREPRHPAGLLPRRARVGPRRAHRGHRGTAARAGVFRPRDDHGRPRSPLLAPELARCDQRRDRVRRARDPAR